MTTEEQVRRAWRSLVRIDKERRHWRGAFCGEASVLGLVALAHRQWFLLIMACLGVVFVLVDLATDRWAHTR